MTQREMRRPGAARPRSRDSGTSGDSAGAGEVAIVGELLVLRSRGRFRRSRAGRGRAVRPAVAGRLRWLVRAGFPACGRVSLALPEPFGPCGVGVDPVPQLL